MNIDLVKFSNENELVCSLIRGFWKVHNNYEQSESESYENLREWTKDGHKLYLIKYGREIVGFIHLGNRGSGIDWLEDIFVLPEYQGNGIGFYAIFEVERIVRKYSQSLYIEVSAKNERAIRLYRRLGFDCLNTVTIRKDFSPEEFKIVKSEKLFDLDFDVKEIK